MPSAVDSTPARLLVADDQPDVLEALRWLLTAEGYEPEFVSSTEAVLERLRASPVDLLLMDLNYTRDTTSGREGLELITKVRALDGSLPIVVMTGWGSIDTAVEAMRRGAKSFVQKPWEDVTLLEIVEREVEEGRAARRRDHKQQREAEEARLIQRGLLPTTTPQVQGIDLSVTWLPADGVGGDCFDTLGFGNVLGVSIADIAGKGLPAALLMSNLQAAVRAFAQDAVSPASINNSINRLLCRNMASGRFATFCYARIEPASSRIVYSNAGHNPPLLIRPDGTVEKLGEGGMVLGIFPDNQYEQAEMTLTVGDRLLFYTDGITEARNPEGDEYGEDRLAEVALAVREGSAETIKDAVLTNVNAFTNGKFEDDATLIVVGIG
ncbi:MAG TPA: SpoIIE family protein phosphatase [Vicinamibacterales bacterium]|nr:SpoIIE family protein phosphatase [Vicinamibacterales bacterium]